MIEDLLVERLLLCKQKAGEYMPILISRKMYPVRLVLPSFFLPEKISSWQTAKTE